MDDTDFMVDMLEMCHQPLKSSSRTMVIYDDEDLLARVGDLPTE